MVFLQQPKPYELGFLDLVISKKITCSGVGGVESTKRMLEFCAKNNVSSYNILYKDMKHYQLTSKHNTELQWTAVCNA